MTGVVFVTGAAGGIGSAVVERFRRDGRTVVGVDRAPGAAVSHTLDVTDREAVEATVSAVERECGPIDILVNAAGILRVGDVLDSDPDDFTALLAVNTVAVATVSRAVAARMTPRRRGAIVTVTSNAAGVPRAGMAAYGASKAAAASFTTALALELAPVGIRCNIVAPGTTRTPMLAETGHDVDAAVALAVSGDPARSKLGIPLGRVAEPLDIAEAVAFFASDAARHITMQQLYVDGGASLR
ncbi:MAG: SDR family oxidoreductase [Microbacterium sp.]